MQSAGRPASSYYDPEGETIYLSPTPAPKGPEKARRRPELNDVFGYVGSATLLVAHSSVRKSIYGAFEAPTGPHAIDAVLSTQQVFVRREPDFAQAPRRRRLHEPLRVRVRRLQLLLQEGLRPHVPRDLLVRHRVRCDGEALHISLLLQEGRTGITRGQGGTRLRPRWRLRR